MSRRSLGSLILLALQGLHGSELLRALESAQDLLATKGRVLPISPQQATLYAELADGKVIVGEGTIDNHGNGHRGLLAPISQVFLRERLVACEATLRALTDADVIVLGPGDLYTSILPNLLAEPICEAIRASRIVLVCNLMTKRGETAGFIASDFVQEVYRYLGKPVDRVVPHDGSFPKHLLAYACKQQYPMHPYIEAVREQVADVIVASLVSIHGAGLARHDGGDLLVHGLLGDGRLSQAHDAEAGQSPSLRVGPPLIIHVSRMAVIQ